MKRKIKFTFCRSSLNASFEAILILDSSLTGAQITNLVYDFAGSFCKNVKAWSWSVEVQKVNGEKID